MSEEGMDFYLGWGVGFTRIPFKHIKNDSDNSLKLFLKLNKSITSDNIITSKETSMPSLKKLILNTDAKIGLQSYEVDKLAKRFTTINATSLKKGQSSRTINAVQIHNIHAFNRRIKSDKVCQLLHLDRSSRIWIWLDSTFKTMIKWILFMRDLDGVAWCLIHTPTLGLHWISRIESYEDLWIWTPTWLKTYLQAYPYFKSLSFGSASLFPFRSFFFATWTTSSRRSLLYIEVLKSGTYVLMLHLVYITIKYHNL